MPMKKIFTLLPIIFTAIYTYSQDNCSNAIYLCASNKITATTAAATASPGDPVLFCGDGVVNNNVWFIVQGISAGTATVTVTLINNTPGLEMEVYTGSCGSLAAIGQCTSANGPGGSMSLNFAVAPGVLYYIMIDGASGNQESFEIQATSPGNSILARPDPNFNTNPASGCNPLNVFLENTTILNGGTNITYQWRIDGVPYVASGADTNIVLSGMGIHTIELRVCNSECGCKAIIQDVIVQDLVPAINYTPVVTCIGTPVNFTGSASIQPDPPFVNPVITSWLWDFGDPASGVNNTSTLQNPSHTFIGPGNSFTVKLVVDGTCGPDSTTITINLLPPPVVDAGQDQVICEGFPAILNSSISNPTLPVSFNWDGPGTINCDTCQLASVSGLSPGGPYTFVVSIVDGNGCIASDTVEIVVNPTPVVDAGIDATVCRWSQFMLGANVISGAGPFTYNWSPASGLDNPNIADPTATVTGNITYCITVTDSAGCVSAPDCIDISIFPPPSLTSASTSICAGDPPPLTNTFNVTGAGAGSDYSWSLSADYNLITGANGDSSSITASFPAIPGSYNFTAVVTDGVTGCIDTVSTSFSVDPPPVLTVNGPFTICEGQSAGLTASGATTYNWTANPVYPFTDPTLPNQNVSPGVSTTFVVTGTTGSCVVTDTVQVTVNPLPVVVVAPLAPICGCDSVLLEGTGSSTGSVVYNWTSSSGSTITDPGQLNTTGYACVGGTFTLTVTDTTTGCVNSAGSSLTQTPKPAATAQVNPVLICDGVTTNVTLNGTGSDTNPGTTYNWSSSPPVSIADPSALNTTAVVNTAITFTLTVTDINGCDSIVSVTVNIYPVPVIAASPNSLCTSDPVQSITIEILGAEAGSTFNWTVPGCVTPSSASASSETFDFTSCGSGNFTFTVIIIQGVSGCIDTLEITIPVDTAVILSITPDQTICEGDNLTLSASGAANYVWNTNDSTSSISVSPALAGNPHTYTVIGSTGGCTDTASVTITVIPIPPPPSLTGPLSICEGANGTIYSVNLNPGSTYTWNVTGGAIASGQGTNTINVDWGTSGSGSVSVFETNPAGCPSQPTNINVTINPIPLTTSISGPANLCADSSGIYSVTGLSGSNFNWSISGGVITSGQGTNTINVTWGSSGGGSLSVIETSTDGCAGAPQNLNVIINSNPITSSVTGPDSLCNSGTGIQYSVAPTAGSVYTWTISGGNITSGQGTNIITTDWLAPPGGFVTVLEENSSGCFGTPVNLNVYVAEPPTASVTASDTICRNETLQLNGVAANGTITWSTTGSGIISDPTIANPTYNPGLTDSGTVSFTITVINQPCTDAVAIIDVYINPAPPALNISGPGSACEGDLGNTYSVTGNFGSNFIWGVNGGSISSGQGTNSITVDWGAAGTGTVIIADTNVYGCFVEPDTLFVTINPLPSTSVITGDTTVCEGASGIIYSVPPTPGINYSWSITGGTITSGQGTNSITVDWTTAGSGSLVLTETSAAGCSAPAQTYIINIESPPITPVPSGPSPICLDTIQILYFVIENPGSIYNWTINGGTIVSGQGTDSIYVTWNQPGPGSISVTEINGAGCAGNTESINITVNPLPVTSSIAGPTIICENTSGSVYTVSATTGSTFDWQVTGGILVSGQGTNAATIDWGAAGFGSVTVTETSADGCIGSAQSTNVIINGIPTVDITGAPSSICAGLPINLTANGGPGTINWTANISGTFTGENTLTPVFNTGTTGVALFTIVISNAPCPSATDTISVVIHPNPTVAITASQSIPICEGTTITLTASGAGNYVWAPGGENTPAITVLPSTSATYIVTGTDLNNCQATDTIEVVVIPAAISSPGADITICTDLNVPLSGSVSNAAGGIWTSSGFGTFVPANNVLTALYQPTPDDLNNGNVTLYLTTQGGCSVDVDSLMVTFVDGSDLDAGPDQEIPSGTTVQLAGNANNPQNVSWSSLGSGVFQPSPNIINPVYVPSNADYLAGGVTLIMSNSFGCSDTMRLTFSEFFIPNVITPLPHSPGQNDDFVIKGLPDNSEILIFDRWGLKIFESTDYRNNWNAEGYPDDTYFYILALQDDRKYNGIIRVIRNNK